MPTRAARPYQGRADADPKGISSGSWTRTSVRRGQNPAGMPATHPGMSWSPRQVPPLAGRLYKGRPVVGPGGKYARRDSNPHPHGPQPCPSASCGTSAREPPPGVEPGHPPYEGEAASRARRRSCPSWIRTTIRGFRGRRPAVRRKGTECGRCDSNAQTARFELARSSGCRHSRVRRLGFEPRTP